MAAAAITGGGARRRKRGGEGLRLGEFPGNCQPPQVGAIHRHCRQVFPAAHPGPDNRQKIPKSPPTADNYLTSRGYFIKFNSIPG